MGIIQEKFQTVLPSQPDGDNKWKSFKSAEAKKGIPSGNNAFFNTLPPGMDIEDAEIADIRQQPLHLAGEGDVSGDTNRGALRKGFTRREMRPTDDEFTRQHNDAFYDECTVDGQTGYLERNNMLDRL